jgi:EF-P beta-lysylation protein EpmB
MISHSSSQWQSLSWQKILQNAIRTKQDLLRALEIEESSLSEACNAPDSFPILAPRPFVERMEKRNPNDPLLRQVLATEAEWTDTLGKADPLDEAQFSPVPGLIHKYSSRVLLITAGTCAVNCRYCFRRHADYQASMLTVSRLESVHDYISQNTGISEVILSGGDPLMLSDSKLSLIIGRLESIQHLKRLRIHTRLPIVIPQRITAELCQQLRQSRLRTTVVVHANHAREIDLHVTNAVRQLRSAGVTVLNQAVLLKGVNDNPDSLVDLSETLFEADILPYYLHTFDPVLGAMHFERNLAEVLEIFKQVQARLPGYLLPKLVNERPGEQSKTLLATS